MGFAAELKESDALHMAFVSVMGEWQEILPVFKLLLGCLRDLPEFVQARCLRKRGVATVFELRMQTFPSQRPSDRKPNFEKSPVSL